MSIINIWRHVYIIKNDKFITAKLELDQILEINRV